MELITFVINLRCKTSRGKRHARPILDQRIAAVLKLVEAGLSRKQLSLGWSTVYRELQKLQTAPYLVTLLLDQLTQNAQATFGVRTPENSFVGAGHGLTDQENLLLYHQELAKP